MEDTKNKIQITELTDAYLEKWDAFVESHPDSTFFHKAGWKQVIEEAFGHKACFFLAELDGEIQGILPLGQIKSLIFGNSLISTPFCVTGGAIGNSEEIVALLEKAAIELAETLNVGYLEMRYTKSTHESWHKKDDLYVSFKKEIDPDVEKNMLAIPRKQRAVVRKGIETGLRSEWDESTDRLYDAYSQSVHALGTPVFSKSYFQILKRTFKNDCRILTITKEGALIASVMSFYFKDQVIPYYGGGTAEARQAKGNDFMYWELMRHSCEEGIRIFDYGRSKVGTGSYNFKKNWGFIPEPLSYEYHLVQSKEMPNISPTNPKYKIFIQAWKKMPLWMTRVIGPHIVKYTG